MDPKLTRSSTVCVVVWTCLFANVVFASFSNIHFEFNEAANILNIDYHNDTKVFTDFAERLVTRVQQEMVYDDKSKYIKCLPFNGSLITESKPSVKVDFTADEGFVNHFRVIDVASPVSINNVNGTVFNVSVLFRFHHFSISYHKFNLSINGQNPTTTVATVVFSNDSYVRLNMSFDKALVKSTRLLGVSLPHYCPHEYKIADLSDDYAYLIVELGQQILKHFEEVEKKRLVDHLYNFFRFIVETTWYGEFHNFKRLS